MISKFKIFLFVILLSMPTFTMEEPSNVDLCDTKVLQSLLAEQFQDIEHLSSASEIVNRIYEVNARFVGVGDRYGYVYPMYPEILRDLMLALKESKAQGKQQTVLEIGGASGENAILLAFAGADKVYLNDIDETEIVTFEKIKEELPHDVRCSLKSIKGSVFDLLSLNPELQGAVDTILCRNVLHFFKDEDLPMFFEILNTIAKPNATIVFTVNGCYSHDVIKSILEQYSTITRFNWIRGLFTKWGENIPCLSYFEKFSMCPEDLDPLNYTKFCIGTITKDSNDMSFAPDMDDIMKNEKKATENWEFMTAAIQGKGYVGDGVVSYLESAVHLYTLETLSELFQSYGFQVRKTLLIARSGHLINGNVDPWSGDIKERAPQIGIVASKI